LRTEIEALPDSGLPAQLKQAAAEQLVVVTDILGRECFFEETASLGNAAAEIDRLVADTTTKLTRQQTDLAQEELSRWQASADWSDLKEDEKVWFSEEINRLAILVAPDLDGLKKLLSHDFSLNHRLRDLSAQLGRKAAAHRDSAHKVEVDSTPIRHLPLTSHRRKSPMPPQPKSSLSPRFLPQPIKSICWWLN